jgi:ribosomal protein L35
MKLKTRRAARKRFLFSSQGKVRRRHVNQAHFNSRESGNDKRHKRGAMPVHVTNLKQLRELMPHS